MDTIFRTSLKIFCNSYSSRGLCILNVYIAHASLFTWCNYLWAWKYRSNSKKTYGLLMMQNFLFELFLVWTYRLRNKSIPCGCNMPFNFLGSLWMNLLLCVPWHRRLLRQNVQGRVGVDVRIRNENTLLNSTCKACKKWK